MDGGYYSAINVSDTNTSTTGQRTSSHCSKNFQSADNLPADHKRRTFFIFDGDIITYFDESHLNTGKICPCQKRMGIYP